MTEAELRENAALARERLRPTELSPGYYWIDAQDEYNNPHYYVISERALADLGFITKYHAAPPGCNFQPQAYSAWFKENAVMMPGWWTPWRQEGWRVVARDGSTKGTLREFHSSAQDELNKGVPQHAYIEHVAIDPATSAEIVEKIDRQLYDMGLLRGLNYLQAVDLIDRHLIATRRGEELPQKLFAYLSDGVYRMCNEEQLRDLGARLLNEAFDSGFRHVTKQWTEEHNPVAMPSWWKPEWQKMWRVWDHCETPPVLMQERYKYQEEAMRELGYDPTCGIPDFAFEQVTADLFSGEEVPVEQQPKLTFAEHEDSGPVVESVTRSIRKGHPYLGAPGR